MYYDMKIIELLFIYYIVNYENLKYRIWYGRWGKFDVHAYYV